jgi:vacuolar-type H+-ATPase subunit C/Vma6
MKNMNTAKTIIRFYENSYQYQNVEVLMEGLYTDLFDGISNEFNKLHSYRGGIVSGLWADVLYDNGSDLKVTMFRVIELTPKMVEVVEMTKGIGFEPIDSLSEAERWKWVITNPKELNVLVS